MYKIEYHEHFENLLEHNYQGAKINMIILDCLCRFKTNWFLWLLFS